MTATQTYTLPKKERLNSRLLIERLFSGGGKSLPTFPLRIGEAYRKHKDILLDALNASGKKAIVAFIWLDNNLHSSQEVEEKVKHLLQLTTERLV